MAVDLLFSIPTGAFSVPKSGTGQFQFHGPLSNSIEIPKDASDAKFIVANGWVGRPGDALTSRVVILNPRQEVVFDGANPADTFTDELWAVKAIVCSFHFGASGWHKIRVLNDQHLQVEYPFRIRRGDMTATAMKRKQRGSRQ